MLKDKRCVKLLCWGATAEITTEQHKAQDEHSVLNGINAAAYESMALDSPAETLPSCRKQIQTLFWKKTADFSSPVGFWRRWKGFRDKFKNTPEHFWHENPIYRLYRDSLVQFFPSTADRVCPKRLPTQLGHHSRWRRGQCYGNRITARASKGGVAVQKLNGPSRDFRCFKL